MTQKNSILHTNLILHLNRSQKSILQSLYLEKWDSKDRWGGPFFKKACPIFSRSATAIILVPLESLKSEDDVT